MATTLGNGTITFGDGTTLSSASMINSIQRGTVSVSAASGVVNISAVVTSKCMVIITGMNSSMSYYGTILAIGHPWSTTFNSTTQFAFNSTMMQSYSPQCNFSWQVIEFK